MPDSCLFPHMAPIEFWRTTAFGRDDERADARVAVVSARIWRDYLGGAEAIGKPIVLNGIAHRVVGVMPDVFEDPLVPGVEIWLPLDTRGPRRNPGAITT
jgi:hypothetical protein